MNKKLGLLAAVGIAAASIGIDLNRTMPNYTHPRKTTKESLSKEEQDIKIFKAEEKRLTKALKKKLITQEEFELKLNEAKQKPILDTLAQEQALRDFQKEVLEEKIRRA